MDNLQALGSLGITLPSVAYIIGAVIFGLAGFVAYRHGKRTQHPVTRWLGVALMFYPYAVEQTWLLYVVGALLCAGIYIDLRR